jgi:CBS-domain-containing membrane protein
MLPQFSESLERSGGEAPAPELESARKSLQPIPGADRALRRRLSLKDEFLLATLPTVVVLVVLATVESLSQQRVLFASLASSAFLIYLDPQHESNSMRSLVLSHLTAALVGAATEALLGAGYMAAGAAMVVTIVLIIAIDAVHPPAIGTALSFAFRPNDVRALSLFVLCLLIIAVLVALQRSMLFVLSRITTSDA